jgi:site-specific recombinase XerC
MLALTCHLQGIDTNEAEAGWEYGEMPAACLVSNVRPHGNTFRGLMKENSVKRILMPIYISRGRFTTDAIKGMMAKAENRSLPRALKQGSLLVRVSQRVRPSGAV